MMKAPFAILLFTALAACGATPRHYETQVDKTSALEFRHGPAGAVIMVDGREIARLADAKTTIVPVADGMRSLSVTTAGGTTLFKGDVFIQDGTRKVIELDR
jgi:hypothetical protein